MKGLALSEKYFHECGLPMIQEKFMPYSKRIAAGLVGDGSECFGYDDEISMDHDWGPGFCVWLNQEDYGTFGRDLQEEMSRLPDRFSGYGPRRASQWGSDRVGVFEISDFFRKFIGRNRLPETNEEWLFLPENALAACTNGKVFHDPAGEFSTWRKTLRQFYPEDVRLKKMASRCMSIAQFGQYNFERCVKRKEFFAAQYAETKFCADVISFIFLLNKRYTLFFKWMHRALGELPILGEWTRLRITRLTCSTDPDEKIGIIEEICGKIIGALLDEGLTDITSDFLLEHGPRIQNRIRDDQLRERNVWIG